MSALSKIDSVARQRFGLGSSGGSDWEWEIVRRGRILGKLLLTVLGRLSACKKGVETSS
jgi:hypothetical protein